MDEQFKLIESFLLVQWLSMLVSFIVCIIISFKYNFTNNLKVLRAYVVFAGISALVSVVSFFCKPEVRTSLGSYFDATIIFHLGLLSAFFYLSLPKKYSKLILALFSISFVFTAALLINDWGSSTVSRSFLTANISLVIMSIIYYWELMNGEPKSEILKDSTFWVITGVLIGMATNVVLVALSKLILIKYDNINYGLTGVLSSLFYAVMHAFFIKSFLCFKISQQS